ncbi:MAG: hypothetical protein Q7T59_03235, partial [Candidatus Woesebacteria bacterium]|nr:hypothetical protein [Candidatus Woesebacteria bacterium]
GGAVSGVSGASPIWNKIMKFTLDRSEKGTYDPEDDGHSWPLQPSGIVGANICADTGGAPLSTDPAQAGCPVRFEYFIEGTVPTTSKIVPLDLQLDKTTGQISGKDTPPENIETQNRPTYTDPLKTIYCMNCPIASSSAMIRYPLK